MSLGHVSARNPGDEVVWIKPRGLGLEEVSPETLLAIDLEGRRVCGQGEPPGEWAIHTEVYRAHSAVNCVIHTHSFWAVVFGVTGLPFRVLTQHGVVFYRGVRILPESPLVIDNRADGAKLAAALGDANVLLLPNHGVVIAASSVEEAVLLALNLEKALKVLVLVAMCGRTGRVTDPASAAALGSRFLGNRARTDHLFNYCLRKAEKALSFVHEEGCGRVQEEVRAGGGQLCDPGPAATADRPLAFGERRPVDGEGADGWGPVV